MSQFIELTVIANNDDLSEYKMVININHIATVEPCEDEPGALIAMSYDDEEEDGAYRSKETYEEVKEKLQKLQYS